MKLRLILVSIVMAVFGVAFTFRPISKPFHRDEAWLQNATPRQVDGFVAQPGPHGENQTYRVSEQSYELIDAYGVDSLIFSDGRKNLDVCVIASNKRESFHDPMLCFPGSDWKILNQRVVNVDSKTRGSIPFSLIQAKQPSGVIVLAAYTYKAPLSMVTSQGDMYLQWSRVNFLTGQPYEGAFYRFIGDESTSEAELLKFSVDFMDEVKLTSKGVL
jgi:hypothetical protein